MAEARSHPGDEAAIVAALLGGPKRLGAPRAGAVDYVKLVRDGLPFHAFRTVTDALTLSIDDVATSLGLSPRTLHRRKQARLTPVESERVVRLARVVARAEHVLGERAAALDWLKSPNRALQGATPLGLLDTDVGAEEVFEVLDRIEYGVYS